MLAYMDACPEDTLCVGKENRWHTLAMVLATEATGVDLEHSWDTSDPLASIARALRATRLGRMRRWRGSPGYRTQMMAALPTALALLSQIDEVKCYATA